MGRHKIKRNCFFIPEFTHFKPENSKGTMKINSDEIEALFLLDYQDMYQEEAAKKMNISRPTLSRIIKNARKKLTTALILGYEIKIIHEKDNFIVAMSISNENDFSHLSNSNELIALIHLENKTIQKITYIKNPMYKQESKPAKILPELLTKYKVHYWVTNQIGEGFKSSLLANGIFSRIKDGFKSKDEIVKFLCCNF
ncbi:DUF134 domain-containing protein [Sulfurospirillum sp. 1307]|jgi:predicted DNA-binding protein (UPF0251 family)